MGGIGGGKLGAGRAAVSGSACSSRCWLIILWAASQRDLDARSARCRARGDLRLRATPKMPPLASSADRFQAAKIVPFSDCSGTAASFVGLPDVAALPLGFRPGGAGGL